MPAQWARRSTPFRTLPPLDGAQRHQAETPAATPPKTPGKAAPVDCSWCERHRSQGTQRHAPQAQHFTAVAATTLNAVAERLPRRPQGWPSAPTLRPGAAPVVPPPANPHERKDRRGGGGRRRRPGGAHPVPSLSAMTLPPAVTTDRHSAERWSWRAGTPLTWRTPSSPVDDEHRSRRQHTTMEGDGTGAGDVGSDKSRGRARFVTGAAGGMGAVQQGAQPGGRRWKGGMAAGDRGWRGEVGFTCSRHKPSVSSVSHEVLCRGAARCPHNCATHCMSPSRNTKQVFLRSLDRATKFEEGRLLALSFQQKPRSNPRGSHISRCSTLNIRSKMWHV